MARVHELALLHELSNFQVWTHGSLQKPQTGGVAKYSTVRISSPPSMTIMA